MSVLFNPFAKFWRKRSTSKEFRDDERGIVTVQMVMFSVMLFGGVGLMMDFGRAYSAHSQMQGYIDQVALAAAQQLDGKDDSIARATAAAQAVSKNSAFISGDGSFKLSGLTFMSAAPTDQNGEFSASLAATHNTTQSELATYVKATASSTSVAVKLLSFASDGNGITDINIAASAVATSRRVSCGGLSPMVMCNPFEASTDTSWQEEIENGIGYRMMLTANDTNWGKPSNRSVSGNFDQLQLGLLKSPDSLMNVRNTICTNTSNLPGATTSTSEQMRKEICLLATIDAGLSCVNDQVAYRAAHPEVITTGLDVIFDLYEDSMADVVDPAQDFSFNHTFPASNGWPASILRSSLFYPDVVVGTGRMRRDAFDVYLDNQEYAINNTTYNPNPFVNAFIKNGNLANLANRRAAYGSDPSIQWSSRQNHPFDSGKRTEWGPAPKRTCLEVGNCDTQGSSSYPVIYMQAPGVNEVENYAAALYSPHLLKQAHAANAGVYPNWWNAAPHVDVGSLVNGYGTYYEFYKHVERVNADLQAEGSMFGHDRDDGTGAWIDVDPMTDYNNDGNPMFDADDIHYGTEGNQVSPINYPSVYGALPANAEERRRQRVTIVNCEAAQAYSAATGDTDPTYSDTYMADVVDVVDIFMITPPQVKECATGTNTLDPDGNYLCENADITQVSLDVELVDAASINSVNFDTRFYAVLVH